MMKEVLVSLICLFIPVKSWRKELREGSKRNNRELVNKYLFGLSGVEIGGSGKSYGLDSQKGSYANIDIVDAETRAESKGWKTSQLVNILSSGDNLPFKDEVFDYVFNSHVVEHFFDPIKAVKEWFRVIKKGGYIVMVIPHKARTFDKNRQLTSIEELMERHMNKLSFTDYAKRTKEDKLKHETEDDKDHHILINGNEVPAGWERFSKYDFRHHWSVWDTNSFLDLCEKLNWDVLEYADVSEQGNDFTVILKK